MPVEAVLFDYGGVLTELPSQVFAKMAVAAGADPAELGALLLGGYEEDGAVVHPWHQIERGEITLDALDEWGWREGVRRGWNLRLRSLVAVVAELGIRPGIVDYILRLRARGYRTGLVTNNVRELTDVWRAQVPVSELFEVVVNSCDVGLRKPDPAIFLHTLDRLGGVGPERVVMLDDLEVNVAAAVDLGMMGVLVGADLERALDQLEQLIAPEWHHDGRDIDGSGI